MKNHHTLLCGLLSLLISVIFQSKSYADVSVIVHPDNPIERLTPRQVKKLFLGRLRMMPNASTEAKIIDQAEDQPTFSHFYTHIIKMKPVKLKRYRASYLFSGKGKLPTVLKHGQAVKEHIASHSDAIGYVDSSLIDSSVKVIFPVKTE
ncbi:hypothetical protein A9Q99_22645 [Gammaproteobacteria bacterium 45_16_T64]|nr:hypothetical protein A9Q99_22645 [Gammaproteobacteria bacterium 45_16_T64]